MSANQRTCDLCGNNGFEVVCKKDRRNDRLDTVACLGCGMVGHAVIPSEGELIEYYSSKYRKEYHGEDRPSSRRVYRAHLKGQRVLKQIGSFLKPGARVFEVGAGIGCTVKVFQDAGFDASGIEPGMTFQHFSQNELRANVANGTLDDYRTDRPFDLVLFIHVIEHMRSPRAALEAIHRLIAPGGLLYLECPSLGKECANIAEHLHFAHLHTFTPIVLLTMLKRCGFAVEHCYSDGVGRNHKFLLRRVEPSACPIDPAGLGQTRDFLMRFQNPWRRFGLGYVARRMRRISIYMKEFLWGKQEVQKLLHDSKAA